jgi:rubrerythrin
MSFGRLLADRDREPDGGTERSVYWCTVCGMVFERSSPSIDYFWCTRCGADGVRELDW